MTEITRKTTETTANVAAAPFISQSLPSPAGASGFNQIRQGTVTNELTKAGKRRGNTIVDQITGAASILQGDITVTFPSLGAAGGLKTSAHRLLDAFTVELTETGAKGPTVTMQLSDYMAKCGLSDRKEARKQITADLETLFNARISLKEKPNRGKGKSQEPRGFMDVRICDSKGLSRSGVITFKFSDTFYSLLKGYPVMPYPPQLFRLSAKYNPNSYYFLRRISEHKRMNAGKSNADIIGVQTLLNASPMARAAEDERAGGRHIRERLIDPFERDMDALAETLTWEYCHSNGAPLQEHELPVADYDAFTRLLVHITWNNYPEQAHLIEARTARASSAKKRRGASKKKEERAEA